MYGRHVVLFITGNLKWVGWWVGLGSKADYFKWHSTAHCAICHAVTWIKFWPLKLWYVWTWTRWSQIRWEPIKEATSNVALMLSDTPCNDYYHRLEFKQLLGWPNAPESTPWHTLSKHHVHLQCNCSPWIMYKLNVFCLHCTGYTVLHPEAFIYGTELVWRATQ